MKATYTFDSPDSCAECRLRYINSCDWLDGSKIYFRKCIAVHGHLRVDEYIHTRPEWCPLEFIEEEGDEE